jgi:drug/metabolite transporter (DMT)-like permease
MNKVPGIILSIVGLAMLIWGSFTYTKKEKIIDTGSIEISANRQETVNWPPYVGGFIFVAGIVLLVISKKEK